MVMAEMRPGRLGGLLARDRAPLVLLALLCAVSLAARAAWLGAPCRSPCRAVSDHVLIFDEVYYVNAARVIAGIRPARGAPYADSPLGLDPNSEHPQLAKLVIAGSLELFGDGPLAWRLGSLIFGTVAIVGMFALARAAGLGPWSSLAAAALMAADNLMIVHGRIGLLDIYALALMVWAGAAYLCGRPILAGALIGVGACMKLVAGYLLLVVALVEALRWLNARREAAGWARRLAACAASAVAVFLGLLAVLDRVARPYDDAAGKLIGSAPFAHLAHMVSYAARQTSPSGPRGIASYPWTWLADYKPITYLNVNPARPSPGLYHLHPAVHFIALISPPILLLALPAAIWGGWTIVRGQRDRDIALAAAGLAWTAGTLLPFVALSLVWQRTSYLYYMVIVMPGLYLLSVWLLRRIASRPWLVGLCAFAVFAAAVIAYPLTPLP
jgi:predicted membrane-bound dolichyl-phosphate-mannose-protein mannosyltransferase